MIRLDRDGAAEPVSRDQILRLERGQGVILFFPVQLTTSRIASLTRLKSNIGHYYLLLSSQVRDRALVTFCLIFSLRRLSGRALLLPFLADLLLLLPIFCLDYLSRGMPCLGVSPPSWFSSPTLRRPHLSSPPTYRICCLLALVHLQTTRFPRRCPETGNNSIASGLSLKPITANAVYSLGHRRRPYPLRYCCVGGCL